MGGDVEQRGRQRREANNEHRERHPRALRHSWRLTGSQGTQTQTHKYKCAIIEKQTRACKLAHILQTNFSLHTENHLFTLNMCRLCHEQIGGS